MTTLKLWERPSSYFGATWEGFYSAGFGQHRDSDCLERSNFRVAAKALEDTSAEIVREKHWVVGWVEWIAIPATDLEAIAIAERLVTKAEGYPVLSDEDLSELEHEEAQEVWANCYNVNQRIAYIRDNRREFEFRSLGDLLSCVRGHYFAGYASELIR